MKLGKFGAVLDAVTDASSITPNAASMMKNYGFFVLVTHILACSWWLWKVCSQSEDLTLAFLDDIDWGENPRSDLAFTNGKLEAYIIAFYITTQTLTTVGYGDITPDNTSERVGYSLFFIFNAFLWGNLLSEINTIHESQNKQESQKNEILQDTIKFLHDSECPKTLRMQIIRWARFNEEHSVAAARTKKIIKKLPSDLRKGLVLHLYGNEVSKVPIFAFLTMKESCTNDASTDGANTKAQHHLKFLGDVYACLQYKMYMPGEVLVNFSDPADRLICFIQSIVDIDFDHAVAGRPKMLTLKGNTYIGDMTLIGDQDWANSTSFNFPVVHSLQVEEITEIMVTARGELVQCLELKAAEFHELLQISPQTQAAVLEFADCYSNLETAGLSPDKIKILSNWEKILIRIVAPIRACRSKALGLQLSIHNLKVLMQRPKSAKMGFSKRPKIQSPQTESDDEKQDSIDIWRKISASMRTNVVECENSIKSQSDRLKRIEQTLSRHLIILNDLSTFVHGRSDISAKQRDMDASLLTLLKYWKLDDEADRLTSVARVYTLEDLDSMHLEDVDKFGLRLGFRKLIQARNPESLVHLRSMRKPGALTQRDSVHPQATRGRPKGGGVAATWGA